MPGSTILYLVVCAQVLYIKLKKNENWYIPISGMLTWGTRGAIKGGVLRYTVESCDTKISVHTRGVFTL